MIQLSGPFPVVSSAVAEALGDGGVEGKEVRKCITAMDMEEVEGWVQAGAWASDSEDIRRPGPT
jgi:hypothetical protein